MDTTNAFKSSPTPVSNESIFSGKNALIFFLVVLVVLSFLGVNLLTFSGNLFDNIKTTVFPYFEKLMAMFGYSTGIFIDKAADKSADAIKFGADVTKGAVQSLSNLLITASKPKLQTDEQNALDSTLSIQKPLCKSSPQPDSSTSSTQSPVSSGKQNWCLVEEDGNQRQCVRVSDLNKCMSGQVFPSQKMCLNPNFTP